jgi:hypothetical protein
MSTNKSAGLDGLPKEFYTTFWPLLGADLVAVLNASFHMGFLSTTMRRGIISLIFKKNERFLCKNWRPILLLCVDYKLASRVIACRLRNVIASVVSPDQTCSVPDWFIGENVRLLSDAISYANHCKTPLALISLDQEKAFDRVEWEFLLRILHKMGFGPHFCRWICTFYAQPQSAVLVNGFLLSLNLFARVKRRLLIGIPCVSLS